MSGEKGPDRAPDGLVADSGESVRGETTGAQTGAERFDCVLALANFLDRCAQHGVTPAPDKIAFAIRQAVSDDGAAWSLE